LRGANNNTASAKISTKLHNDDEKPDKALKIKVQVDDTEKKIKNLRKKLTQINELKQRQAQGEKLEKNQLDKLQSEREIVDELKKLGATI
jgi:translation initiation factor 2A